MVLGSGCTDGCANPEGPQAVSMNTWSEKEKDIHANIDEKKLPFLEVFRMLATSDLPPILAKFPTFIKVV